MTLTNILPCVETRPFEHTGTPRNRLFAFAQSAQRLVDLWGERDAVRRLSAVWDVILTTPRCPEQREKAVLASILYRMVVAFWQAETVRGPQPAARVERQSLGQLHVVRALRYLRSEFPNHDACLRSAAQACNVSPPYLSMLISSRTRHQFSTHLSGLRVIKAAHLLGSTTLSIKEVARYSGLRSTAALDHAFSKWCHLTPSEFTLWGPEWD
jgi:AraC-like DNA-binding protein